MAIRNIRKDGDRILRKESKEVENINEKIGILLKDMAETMYRADGVGIAAPQVGILKRVIVIDVREGNGLLELVNPRVVDENGEQIEAEGCLSIPGVYGEVRRPARVVVEALNSRGETIVVEGEKMLARVLSHEIDHLNGILFKDKAIRFINPEEGKKS